MRGRTPFIRTSVEFVQRKRSCNGIPTVIVKYGDDLGEEHDPQLRKESRDRPVLNEGPSVDRGSLVVRRDKILENREFQKSGILSVCDTILEKKILY